MRGLFVVLTVIMAVPFVFLFGSAALVMLAALFG